MTSSGTTRMRCDGRREPSVSRDTISSTASRPTGFEADNPTIKIKPVDILADDYAEKLTTMLAGGDQIDVLTM